MRRLFGRGGGERYPAEWLVVGLGNPGPQYAKNRHNLGVWTVAELARRGGVQLKGAGATLHIGVGTLSGRRTALVRPKTYVNESGKALRQAQGLTGCDGGHTIVVYDELDLTAGALRIRAGGGAGGHNGMKNVIQHIGADFIRVRMGIGRPVVGDKPTWDPDHVADWVLSDPAGEQRALLEETSRIAADAVEAIIADGVEAAAQRFTRR
jgi:PTH1 family peptidyl-tRNA hydrolase